MAKPETCVVCDCVSEVASGRPNAAARCAVYAMCCGGVKGIAALEELVCDDHYPMFIDAITAAYDD